MFDLFNFGPHPNPVFCRPFPFTFSLGFPRQQSEAHDVHIFVEDKLCFPAQRTSVQIALVR